jgi:hypothetical protein
MTRKCRVQVLRGADCSNAVRLLDYINAAKAVFKKQTVIVIDRFHIAKQHRGELDKYRQKN